MGLATLDLWRGTFPNTDERNTDVPSPNVRTLVFAVEGTSSGGDKKPDMYAVSICFLEAFLAVFLLGVFAAVADAFVDAVPCDAKSPRL